MKKQENINILMYASNKLKIILRINNNKTCEKNNSKISYGKNVYDNKEISAF